MLAHILGRLPCPKKTPRKIWNSMLAQYQYRMKIRKAKNYCRIVNCATKICKNRHKLANSNAIRIYRNGKIFAEASAARQHRGRLAPQNHHTLRNNGEMQTGTLDGSPSKHTPEIQPTADANARWAGTRTIRTYDLRSAIRFGYILY